jgi:hypothetical protein
MATRESVFAFSTRPAVSTHLGLSTRLAVVTFGLALFVVHATLYRDWLVDDSGISIAYATNFANGHGLVSQPGLRRVEGYSNPLWVVVLAALSRAGMLSLPLAPKIVSGIFIAGAYAMLLAIIERVAIRPWLVGTCALAACSLNPAFVIWCTSGLENALYTLGVVSLAYCTTRALESPRGKAFAACGAIAALVAMTRPDGVVFALVAPAVALAAGKRERRDFVPYAATFAGMFGAFILGRVVVFHHLVPNTAVAKGGPKLVDALDFVLMTRLGIDKMDSLLEAVFPARLANVVLVGTVLAIGFGWKRGRISASLGTLVAFAGAALVDYVLMPEDWMRENRFGTAFIPLCYAVVFVLVDITLDLAPVRRKSIAVGAVTGSLLCSGIPEFVGRALQFSHGSNISLFFVRTAFAERFDRYATALGVANPSVLLPDVGGMLIWSHARIYDLAGLCDATIARLSAHDPQDAREYILAEARPTFIHAYGKYSRVALERDPRFATDYVPIHVYDKDDDPDLEDHASGVFLRRDAVASPDAEAVLDAIRRETHKRQAFVSADRPNFLYRWLERTPIVPTAYRKALSSPGAASDSAPPARP